MLESFVLVSKDLGVAPHPQNVGNFPEKFLVSQFRDGPQPRIACRPWVFLN